MDHNTLLTLLRIAGFCIGWMGYIYIIKKTCPTSYQLAIGFIGALIAYTLLS